MHQHTTSPNGVDQVDAFKPRQTLTPLARRVLAEVERNPNFRHVSIRNVAFAVGATPSSVREAADEIRAADALIGEILPDGPAWWTVQLLANAMISPASSHFEARVVTHEEQERRDRLNAERREYAANPQAALNAMWAKLEPKYSIVGGGVL